MKISAVMIVKDEEKNLRRCLGSIKDFVDEIIMVDTGSTDKSIEIAKSYGAMVYEHPWENNFSVHRNQAFDYATGDIAFVIDADEEIVLKKPAQEVKKDLAELSKDIVALAVRLKDWQKGILAMQFNPTRMFRKGVCRYQNIVHNTPVFEGGFSIYPFLEINHYGYDLTPEQKDAKRNRMFALLEKRIADNPEDWEVYFYKGQVHNTYGEFKECIECGIEYISHRKELGIRFNKNVYFTTIRSCMAIDDKQTGSKLMMEAIELYPNDLDLNLLLVEFGVFTNQPFLIEKGATQFIAVYDKVSKSPELIENSFVFTLKPDCLAYCLHCLSIVRIQSGLIQLTNLRNVLPAATAGVKNDITKETINGLSQLGLAAVAKTMFADSYDDKIVAGWQ